MIKKSFSGVALVVAIVIAESQNSIGVLNSSGGTTYCIDVLKDSKCSGGYQSSCNSIVIQVSDNSNCELLDANPTSAGVPQCYEYDDEVTGGSCYGPVAKEDVSLPECTRVVCAPY